MTDITAELMQKFLRKADHKLKGKWVILGGSVLLLLGIEERTTLDIDIAAVSEVTSQKDTLTLMEIAQDIGLPVEAINQAGAFFLEKIPDWRHSLVEIFRGKSCTVYRPNTTLYLQLKINRLSETDLTDCLHMLKFARDHCEDIRKEGLLHLLQTKKHASPSEELNDRIDTLLKKLHKWSL